MEAKKKKLMLIAIIPVMVVFVVLLMISFLSSNQGNRSEQRKHNRMSDIVPDSKSAGDTIDDRLQFLEYQENEESYELMQEQGYNQRGLAALMRQTREGDDKEIAAGRDRYLPKEEEKTTERKKKSTPVSRQKKSAPTPVSKPDPTPTPEPEPQKRHSALSIQRGAGNVYADGSTPLNEKFYRAVTETDLTIREQGQMLFILQEDLYYPPLNKTFPRYSAMYGYSVMSKHYADIIINRIRSTDNKTYNVHLVGYNSNFQRGIRYDGKMDKAMQRTGRRTSGVVGNIIGNQNVTETPVEDLAGDATQNVGQEAFKDVSFGINKGLVMNFRIEIEE